MFSEPGWWVACLLLGILILRTFRERWRAASLRRRSQRGRWAEGAAESVLRRAGYDIVERQAVRLYDLRVDDDDVPIRLVADLLAERRGRRFVVEVKTGEETRANHPETRRQLLEYLLAFDVDGVLLLDMDRKEIHQITFPWEG